MSDLSSFLLARVAEDEERADFVRRQIEGNNWAPFESWALSWHDEYDLLCIEPSRALAECASKRAIVEMHDSDGWDFACEVEGGGLPDPDDCRTLRELASIYVGHPDFRDEWRVES